MPRPLRLLSSITFQLCSYARYPRNFPTLYLCVRNLAFPWVLKLKAFSRTQVYFCCASFFLPGSIMHRIHSSDLSKQCVSTFVLSIESLVTVTLMCACSIDTVVLWDWIISLPREWKYVSPFSPTSTHLCNSRSDISQIWKTSWTPVKVAYLFCRYVELKTSNIAHLNIHRYWVITVVPYLLYAFVNNHSLETCQRIYKVSPSSGA